MLQLLETGRALYLLAAVCLLGILTRAITRHLYKGLLKESGNLTLTKNRSLRELRQRAETTYRMNQGMRDSGAWLEHQLYELKVLGLTLPRWSGLSMQWTWLCLLLGGAGAFFSYWYRLDTLYIVMYGGGAVLMAMVTMLLDSGASGGQREHLVAALQDNLENVMYPRLARNQPAEGGRFEPERAGIRGGRGTGTGRGPLSEGFSGQGTGGFADRQAGGSASAATAAASTGNVVPVSGGGNRKTLKGAKRSGPVSGAAPESAEAAPDSRRDVDYIKRSLEQIAASREKTRAADENWLKDLGPEEVELIGDILKQYLA